MHSGSSNTVGKLTRETSGGIAIHATRLRDILRKHHIGDYSLICDIEGAEFDILKNDREALSICRLMIVEVHGGEVDFEERMNQMGFIFRERKHSTWVFSR